MRRESLLGLLAGAWADRDNPALQPTPLKNRRQAGLNEARLALLEEKYPAKTELTHFTPADLGRLVAMRTLDIAEAAEPFIKRGNSPELIEEWLERGLAYAEAATTLFEEDLSLSVRQQRKLATQLDELWLDKRNAEDALGHEWVESVRREAGL